MSKSQESDTLPSQESNNEASQDDSDDYLKTIIQFLKDPEHLDKYKQEQDHAEQKWLEWEAKHRSMESKSDKDPSQ